MTAHICANGLDCGVRVEPAICRERLYLPVLVEEITAAEAAGYQLVGRGVDVYAGGTVQVVLMARELYLRDDARGGEE